jgi:hypothetical protein
MNTRLAALTRETWIAVALAFVIGLVVGWLVLGWVLFPVSYTNADPWDLNPAAKGAWVTTVADAFSANHDVNLARQRLRGFSNDDIATVLKQEIVVRNQAGQANQAANLQQFASALGVNLAGAPAARTTPGAAPATATSGGGNLLGTLLPLLLGLLLLVFVVGAGLIVYTRMKTTRLAGAVSGGRTQITQRFEELPPTREPAMSAAPRQAEAPRPAPAVAPAAKPAPAPKAAPAATGKGLGTFAATYKFGDDNYDTAFTLETPRGEFLGECGMGISDTIGEGKPDKVTAFDLWLFDKIDVRTVTTILMSEYAFNDQALRSRLAQKGELTLAEKGKHIILETATLHVDASIVDLVYASTPGLPANSHFQKLIVQLEPVQK